jgi:hypothetical protein
VIYSKLRLKYTKVNMNEKGMVRGEKTMMYGDEDDDIFYDVPDLGEVEDFFDW